VWDEVGEGAVVRFANKAVVARREGAAEMDRDFSEVSCQRVPEFDQYAHLGEVPKSAQLAAGWWFTCEGPECFRSVRGNDESTAVVVGEAIYCGTDCRDAAIGRQAAGRE
jgi:hypothetical protein